jgi:hypothetical protein
MQERQVALRGLASSSISGDHVTIYGQQTNEAWVPFAPHLIPREDPFSCSRPRYLQTPPFTCKAYRSPRDSMVIRHHQRVGLQACRSATALGKRNGHGETQRLHPMNRTMVRAIRMRSSLDGGGAMCQRNAARRHTPRETEFRRGYHHRSICSDQVAYTEGRVGWRGHVRDLCLHITPQPNKPRIVVRKEKRICTSA